MKKSYSACLASMLITLFPGHQVLACSAFIVREGLNPGWLPCSMAVQRTSPPDGGRHNQTLLWIFKQGDYKKDKIWKVKVSNYLSLSHEMKYSDLWCCVVMEVTGISGSWFCKVGVSMTQHCLSATPSATKVLKADPLAKDGLPSFMIDEGLASCKHNREGIEIVMNLG